MKRIYSCLLALALTTNSMVVASCGGSDDPDPQPQRLITISAETASLPATGGAATITVTAEREWGATTTDEWLSLDRTSGSKGSTELTISASQNPTTSEREGMVTLMCGADRQYIKVTQAAADKALYPAPAGYELVWHDEFDSGSELSAADWTHEVQGPGWVNNELQTYVNHRSPGGRNVTEISNGTLRINCFKENGAVYSGRVYAHVNEGWQYGYFEARIKLPSGKGTWPAFWMMPVGNDWTTNPWPMCGEIDIMEEVGVVPNEVSSSVHTQDYNHTKGTQKTHAMTISKAEGEFHTYALEWTADEITTYVDGQVQLAVKKSVLGTGHNQWPFHYAFYPILNLAWGGSWGGMQGVNEGALPVTMEVDYVRVFQKK